MSAANSGEVASTTRSGSSPKQRWIFSKEEMKNAANIKEGMDEWQELEFRQQATRSIQTLADRLNHSLKDPRGKMTQLCICAAMMHMHRFFYFHTFTFFDFRDVAAACLFLAGKSEECPRKLEHIVKVWWTEKFPALKMDTQHYTDAANLIVTIENVILQTIAFDLRVKLPHPTVLNAMHHVAKVSANRNITEVAYFFSTDVLCVTSWGIRYTAEAIAVACIHIVCAWASFEIPPFIDGVRWYHKTDPTMTQEKLNEMSAEFMSIYQTCSSQLALKRFADKGDIVREPKEIAQALQARANSQASASAPVAARALPSSYGKLSTSFTPASSSLASASILPPPPAPPPTLGVSRKVDISEYKERKGTPSDSGHGSSGGSSAGSLPPPVGASGVDRHQHSGSHHSDRHANPSSQSSVQPQPRKNFMPDISQLKGVNASMPNVILPGQESKPPSLLSATIPPPAQHNREHRERSGTPKPYHSSNRPADEEARRRADREARDREKRKREHSMTQLNPHSEKRPRPQHEGNGHHNSCSSSHGGVQQPSSGKPRSYNSMPHHSQPQQAPYHKQHSHYHSSSSFTSSSSTYRHPPQEGFRPAATLQAPRPAISTAELEDGEVD